MRPPRLITFLFCLIFFPIIITFFSALSSPRVTSPNTLADQTSGLHALFSFNIPSSLFPPSAIISLTDDNSTFFLARPAAFGPLLPAKSLSGQLWVGTGFSEGSLTAGVEGELGCSDIPGWGEGYNPSKQDKAPRTPDQSSGKSGSDTANDQPGSQTRSRSGSQADAGLPNDKEAATTLSLTDGTDDHLHHPLAESSVSEAGKTEKYGDYVPSKSSTHADIQSLQETAEIQGNVVLLSRGGCGFLEKVKWAQRRGAIAVIVGDDTRGGSLVTMYARGDTSNVTIPALFTSYTTAHLLSSLIPGHSGAVASLDDSIKSTQAKLAGQANGKQRSPTTSTTTSIPSPTSNHYSAVKDRPAAGPKLSRGFFCTLGSLLGLCSNEGAFGHLGDSRRPPSSGNIDWMVLGSWDEDETYETVKRPGDANRYRGKTDGLLSSGEPGLSSDNIDGDGFVIGVQDWRDPDLVPARASALLKPSTAAGSKDASKTSVTDKEATNTPNVLQGGSITPGSGEYQSIEKASSDSHDTGRKSQKQSSAVEESGSSGNGWFSSHFGWKQDSKSDTQPSDLPSPHSSPMADEITQGSSHSSGRSSAKSSEHEGLWVTLTPTSISTSPFFDTLLVLVVSPLLTLTVVYALLLLRSRIRRRRWRAPKSVVERLPVRTYHTISSSSSSSTSSLRPASPGPVSSTSPLLGSAPRSPRTRSQTISGTLLSASEPSKEEKTSAKTGSTLWRRKYTGRQVECVVCLEEYIDGQSRVMSLPCGHEFHAECITPWLTTRRRTCPICKGDVVRSLGHYGADESRSRTEQSASDGSRELDSRNAASSAPVPVAGMNDDHLWDTEHNADPEADLLEGAATSAPQSSWRNLASLSFSALSGDTIWHQARADRNR